MYKLLLIFLLITSTELVAQNNEPLLSLVINVANGNISNQLYVGIDETATDGIDTELGECELPPFPPAGVFDTRLVGTNIGVPLDNGSLRDYRQGSFPLTTSKTHEIFVQRGSSDIVNFSWNFPSGVTGNLQDFFGGIVVNVSMSGSGSFDLTNSFLSNLKLTLIYNIVSDMNEQSSSSDYYLYQNYPNPFNPITKINFSINQRSNVNLSIYDILGEKLVELVDEELDAGIYESLLDANSLVSGIYIYKLRAGNFLQSRKMILIR